MFFPADRPSTTVSRWGAHTGSALVVALGLALSAARLGGQPTGSLGGRVVDEDGAAIAHASVLVVGTNIGAMTDPDGRFVVRGLPAGEDVRIRVTVIGYASMTFIARAGDMDLSVQLTPP